jgi:asparagine synthase (glutamine-hydrolysing)
MCGILGKVAFDGAPVDRTWLSRACQSLAHRGPDHEAQFVTSSYRTTVALGHRRLRIIDLAERADQPLHNHACAAAGRATRLSIVFNGEIYNFKELRQELERQGHRFTTNADTETVLHLYEDRGPACVDALRGMFAFAIWDADRETLFCARDRLGKKPFYYCHLSQRFWFASEPRAILCDPEVPQDIERAAINEYLTLGYIPNPRSAFSALRRLPPAHHLTVTRDRLKVERYWRLRYGPKIRISEPEAVLEVRRRLTEAVRLRLVSDVPIGALLSGGLDSSAVVALMAQQSSGRIKTFSIGFDDATYNELPYARAVAARCDTDHHESVVHPDAIAVLPKLAWHYGEPFADSSALPTFYVSHLARQNVTVALNGDGGDEAFGGYRRYLAHTILEWLPSGARQMMAGIGKMLPSGATGRSFVYDLSRFFRSAADSPGRRYSKWFGFLDLSPDLLNDAAAAALHAHNPTASLEEVFTANRTLHPADAAMAADVEHYLPDDLLLKVDIASMAFGLEARSPLLDHELQEFAARLPVALKIHFGTGKRLLRRAVANLVPDSVTERSKTGFGVPLDRWFRGELARHASEVLNSRQALSREHLAPGVVDRLLREHTAGHASHGQRLWALLMLEFWRQTLSIDQPAPTPAR